MNSPVKSPRFFINISSFSFTLSLVLIAITLCSCGKESENNTTNSDNTPPDRKLTEAEIESIKFTCSYCHDMVSPDAFPKDAWDKEMKKAYFFTNRSDIPVEKKAPKELSLIYFKGNAPEHFEITPESEYPSQNEKLKFENHQYPVSLPGWEIAGVSHLEHGKLISETATDCLISDARNHGLLLWNMAQPDQEMRVLSDTLSPGHTQIVDLDQDGLQDILVGDLGQIKPTNERTGNIVWLKQNPDDQSFTEIVLAEELGRVADLRADDFDNDGDIDMAIAEYGWQDIGSLWYYENVELKEGIPQFKRREIDNRHGSIRVESTDLNQDGHLDLIVLIAQEFEQVLAYLNDGKGKFTKELLFDPINCAYGSGGMCLADMDQDGDMDILLTNGDTLDQSIYKPYNSVQWLENEGSYPFKHHHLAELQGAYGVEASDFDLDGDMDIIASSFIPGALRPHFTSKAKETYAFMDKLPSVIWMEQTAPGEFTPHTLETGSTCHPMVAVTDVDADGDPDLLMPNCSFQDYQPLPGATKYPAATQSWITVWENQQTATQTASE